MVNVLNIVIIFQTLDELLNAFGGVRIHGHGVAGHTFHIGRSNGITRFFQCLIDHGEFRRCGGDLENFAFGGEVFRTGIQRHLKNHMNVKKYRDGMYGEGEQGVTVVTLK